MFRLIAPETGQAALAYADPGRRGLVVFGYQLEDAAAGAAGGPCPVAGIEEDLDYRMRQFSPTADEEQAVSVRSGRELLTAGLSWPLAAARTAAIWRLNA
jgi:hypothetical protein